MLKNNLFKKIVFSQKRVRVTQVLKFREQSTQPNTKKPCNICVITIVPKITQAKQAKKKSVFPSKPMDKSRNPVN